MTDLETRPASPTGEADRTQVAAQHARVAALAKGRKRRRHPAQGARIAAAGLGATTMLGLVGAMAAAASSAPPPAPAPPAQVVVVVHRAAADTATDTVTGASTGPAEATVLQARPTVRPASPATRTPTAKTSGSR